MRIEKVRVEGFRLLQDVEITLEGNSTVIVGRNNSGKTSFTDIFDRFTRGDRGAISPGRLLAPPTRAFLQCKDAERRDGKARGRTRSTPDALSYTNLPL